MSVAYGPLLLASWLFGIAITLANQEQALAFVLGGLAVLVVCFLEGLRRPQSNRSPSLLMALVWIGLLVMMWLALNAPPLLYPQRPWAIGHASQLMMTGLLLTYLPFLGKLREPGWVCWLRFIGFTVLVVAAGIDTLHTSPAPRIDVWTFQQSGARALLDGQNPYSSVKEVDTYAGKMLPYVYPPLQLYLTVPAFLFGGDVRYTMLAAVVLAGICIRSMGGRARNTPSLACDAPALYLWLTPKLFFVIEQAWIDPVQLMLIALLLVAHSRGQRWVPTVLLGTMLTSKQTMIWAVALVGIMMRFSRKRWLLALACSALLVGPFVVLDWRAFKYANLDYLAGHAARSDALCFPTWWWMTFGTRVPTAVAFVAAALIVVITIWRMPRTRPYLGVALATTYAIFFSFNKWAFANYYFLVAGLSAMAAAMVGPGSLKTVPDQGET